MKLIIAAAVLAVGIAAAGVAAGGLYSVTAAQDGVFVVHRLTGKARHCATTPSMGGAVTCQSYPVFNFGKS